MSAQPRILALAGSLRRESLNKKLVAAAAESARRAGASVTQIDMSDYPLPLFDQDLEAAGGLPEPARQLQSLFADNEGLLLASPEYNSSIPGVLKNLIDWVSRPSGDRPTAAAFQGKTAAIMSASPGAMGGIRGLVHVRAILGNLGVLVLPDQLILPRAHQAFSAEGALLEPAQQGRVDGLGSKLTELLGQLGKG